MMKENFGWSGQMKRRTREFEKPTFKEKSDFAMRMKKTKGKKIKHKKLTTNQNMRSKERRAIDVVL
jgi:hypothetical protein